MRLPGFAGLLVASLAFTSSAATLDFTGSVGAAIAAGKADTAVYSGDAAFGTVTVSANPKGSDLTQVAGSGLGIDCVGGDIACRLDNPNQIDTGEILKISFEQPLFVTSVDIRNLNGTKLGIGWFSVQIEEGGSVTGAGFDVPFNSKDASPDGALTLAINSRATSISFVPNGGFFDAFSVAGISIAGSAGPVIAPPPSAPMPEPSSVLLLIIGAGIVATQVRRHI